MPCGMARIVLRHSSMVERSFARAAPSPLALVVILCAVSGAELVLARGAQGIGAALIAPTALPLVATSFPEGSARNRALGLYGATASVGPVAGLVLGGILITVVGWRAVL